MAAEGQAREKYKEIIDGPSRWDVMLALFDRQLESTYRFRGYRFSGRGVMFSYKTDNDEIRPFSMSVVSAKRQQDGNSELLEELWTLEGYIFNSVAPVKVTDYSFEKRKGRVFADCLW